MGVTAAAKGDALGGAVPPLAGRGEEGIGSGFGVWGAGNRVQPRVLRPLVPTTQRAPKGFPDRIESVFRDLIRRNPPTSLRYSLP